MGFKIVILLRQLSLSRSGVHCPQPPSSSPGKRVPCYTGSWWNPGRHTSQESGFSVCPSEKQKSTVSAFLATVQHSRHLPRTHAWFGRSLHSSISSLLTPFPPAQLRLHYRLHACFLTTPGNMVETCLQTAWLLAAFFLRPHSYLLRGADIAPPSLQAAWLRLSCMAALFTTDWHGCLLLPHHLMAFLHWPFYTLPNCMTAHPYFKCWPRASYMTSYPTPSAMSYFCQFPLYLTSFHLPSLVKARVPHDTGASASLPHLQAWYKFPWLGHKSLYILKITDSFFTGWQLLPFRKDIAINLPLLWKVS